MKLLTLASIFFMGATAQTTVDIPLPSVVFPSDGKFKFRRTADVDQSDENARDEYRRAFSRLQENAAVDFFKSPERTTGQSQLGPKEAFVTPDANEHAYAEPNQECFDICHIEDREIEQLEQRIRELDERYYFIREQVVQIGQTTSG